MRTMGLETPAGRKDGPGRGTGENTEEALELGALRIREGAAHTGTRGTGEKGIARG